MVRGRNDRNAASYKVRATDAADATGAGTPSILTIAKRADQVYTAPARTVGLVDRTANGAAIETAPRVGAPVERAGVTNSAPNAYFSMTIELPVI